MLKLFGAFLLILGSSMWGFSKAIALKNRKENIEKLICCLGLLETEISYGKRDIKSTLKSIGKTEKMPIFSEVSDNLYDISLKSAFDKAMSSKDVYILGTDKLILQSLAEELGRTDTQNQLKCIAYAKCRFEDARISACNEYFQKGKLYRSMGVLLGTAAAVILI